MTKGNNRNSISSDMLDISHNLNVAMGKLQEQYLVRFFGSREEAERLAPYFELEQHPTDVKFEKDGDKITFKIENYIRVKMRDSITDILIKEIE